VAELFQPGAAEQWFWNDGDWLSLNRVGDRLDENESPTWFPHRGTLATCSPLLDEASWSSYEAPVEDAWDLCFGAVSRWSVTVAPTARIYEINSPQDWVSLVERFPKVLSKDRWGGEVSEDLLSAGDPDADDWRRLLAPEWTAVATHFDGVHLSWAGFITTDARPIRVGDGDLTVLRRWGSERTAWLAPVLSDPTPLPVDSAKLDNPLRAEDPRWELEGRQWNTLLHP
jgi:hypothetical protein